MYLNIFDMFQGAKAQFFLRSNVPNPYNETCNNA
jgi:hypothetical protein